MLSFCLFASEWNGLKAISRGFPIRWAAIRVVAIRVCISAPMLSWLQLNPSWMVAKTWKLSEEEEQEEQDEEKEEE